MKNYTAEFDLINDIFRCDITARNLKEAKQKAQVMKREEFENDSRIKATVRLKQ